MPYILESKIESNIGWLFYKYYFENSDRMDIINDNNNRLMDTIANRNETILKRNFVSCTDVFSLNTKHNFSLKVCYPGLLIGSGYTHEAVFDNKDDKNEAFKIGFFFDYVTGMPCIPGHSVKGALRSAFPNQRNDKYNGEKSSMIVDLLKKTNIDPETCFNLYMDQRKISGVTYSDLNFAELLVEIIFEGQEPYQFKNGAFLYEQISLYNKDIFHDAFIVNGGKNEFFMATDYITPHNETLKDPNPVKFLKILPEVEMYFQFDLKDSLITKKDKEELFKNILLDFGIGAKTNVGYGQFEEGFVNRSVSDGTITPLITQKTAPSKYIGRIKDRETKLEAIVVNSEKNIVRANINGIESDYKMSAVTCPANGTIVSVKVNAVNKKNEIILVTFLGEIK